MHRASTSLHQDNKKHKTKHTSKRALKKDNKGKVEDSGASVKASSMKKTLQNAKTQRKNQAKQVRDNKKQQILYRQRLGRTGNPPRIVAVMSLSGQGTFKNDDLLIPKQKTPMPTTSLLTL